LPRRTANPECSSADRKGGLPGKLAFCRTEGERLAWVRAALVRGQTLTEVGMWLGGVDEPKDPIRALIHEGLPIATFRRKLTDAAGDPCTVMAWRLKEGDTRAV